MAAGCGVGASTTIVSKYGEGCGVGDRDAR
jgi:hypothetical protein